MTGALGQAHSIDAMMSQIVDAVRVYRSIALVRIWLMTSSEECRVCRVRDASDHSISLHLMAAGGQSITGARWSRVDGIFHGGGPFIRRVMGSADGLRINDGAALIAQSALPDFIRREQLKSFAGYPIAFRGEALGAITVFSRTRLREIDFARLGFLARALSNAIASIRDGRPARGANFESNHGDAAHRTWRRPRQSSAAAMQSAMSSTRSPWLRRLAPPS